MCMKKNMLYRRSIVEYSIRCKARSQHSETRLRYTTKTENGPVLETVSDVEREEEFAMFLDKLIWKEQVRNGRRVTENKNVENKK